MVLQDTFNFSRAIMDILRFGRNSATQEEIDRAVEAACAKGFVAYAGAGFREAEDQGTGDQPPQGRAAPGVRWSHLSGPQDHASLDEATSSVDPETGLIQQAWKSFLQRTHRSSSPTGYRP